MVKQWSSISYPPNRRTPVLQTRVGPSRRFLIWESSIGGGGWELGFAAGQGGRRSCRTGEGMALQWWSKEGLEIREEM